MKTLNVFVLAFSLFAIAFTTGCADDDPKQELIVNINSKFGSEMLNYNQEYDLNGRKLVITKAQLYLSDFVVNTDPVQELGSVISASAVPIEVNLGSIEAGHAHGLSFKLGLNQEVNHSDPSTYPESSPLSNQNEAFEHWSWNSGYRFVVIEGMVDTNAVPDGVMDAIIEYHIGSDPFLTDIMLTKHADIEADQDLMYTVVIDFARFFDGIDISTENITHTSDNITLANKIKDNFEAVFSIQ